MDINTREHYIHRIFDIGLILKGLHSLVEIGGAILVLLISQDTILTIVRALTQDELSEDPRDFIANYLLHSAQQYSIGTQHFIAFYLLAHGIIKGFLVINLLRQRLWSYPLSIVLFSIFAIYQTYQYLYTYSLWLLALTLLDLILIVLTWHEYRYMRKHGIFKKM